MPTTDEKGRALYKILVNGESCHSGSMTWSLPQQQSDGTWTPGSWHQVDGELRLCENGLHLTWNPGAWWKHCATGYHVETLEEHGASSDADGGKIVVRSCRLLRPMTETELVAHKIFSVGHHEIKDGQGWASGYATVEASGSATVRASGYATVEAKDDSTVLFQRYSGSPKIKKLSGRAVLIDRRDEKKIKITKGKR